MLKKHAFSPSINETNVFVWEAGVLVERIPCHALMRVCALRAITHGASLTWL